MVQRTTLAPSKLAVAALLLVASALALPARGVATPGPSAAEDARYLPARPGEVVVVGELHGTTEIPAHFLGLVRRVAADRPVLVGLELPPEAGRIDCRSARRPLPAYWSEGMRDGRTSVAMRALICDLRAMRRVSLIFLDDSSRLDDFDRAAAERFKQAYLSRPIPGLILTGSYHARNNQGSLAAELRRLGLTVRTVVVSTSGGQAWYCAQDRRCGPRPAQINFCSLARPPAEGPRWVVIADPRFVWDTCLSLPPVTPSPPAAAATAPGMPPAMPRPDPRVAVPEPQGSPR